MMAFIADMTFAQSVGYTLATIAFGPSCVGMLWSESVEALRFPFLVTRVALLEALWVLSASSTSAMTVLLPPTAIEDGISLMNVTDDYRTHQRQQSRVIQGMEAPE